MPEETPAPLNEDQPIKELIAPEPDQATASPEFFSENFDPSTLAEGLQSAYKQMQGDYTRKTQSLAEQRREAENESQQYKDFFESLQDPETQAEALQALGFDFEDDDPQPVDENALMLSEWQQFKESQQSQQREQELDSLERDLEAKIVEATKHLDLSAEERSLIFDHGLAMEPDSNGQMNIAGAVKSFEAAQQKAVDRYLASKRAPKAPTGQQGSTVVDPNEDRFARQERMASLMRASAND